MKVIWIITTVCLLLFHQHVNAEESVKVNNIQFASLWYKYLAKTPGNILFSPFSAHAILSEAYQGSAGTTKEALQKSLFLPEPETIAEEYKELLTGLNADSKVTVNVANKIYVKPGHSFSEKFKTAVEDDFHSEVEALDFSKNNEAAQTINSWVESKTENKIKDLIDSQDLNVDTHLVLVNAIYFKGSWLSTFDKESTNDQPFHVDKDTTVTVPLMDIVTRFNFVKNDDIGAKIIELPFTDRNFRMMIFLPIGDNTVEDVEKNLYTANPSDVLKEMRVKHVHVYLPKFKIEKTVDLENFLRDAGLGELFDPSGCNLSGVFDDGEHIYVSKVIQKVYVDVNENGCEAAAATGLVVEGRTLPDEEFKADRPFIFSISYRNGNSINSLFMGRITNPLE